MPATADARSTKDHVLPNLRTVQKLRTRRALRLAALSLFAERGYEETTVADIAARAEVGLRTFFLHFPAKEDVLFNDWRPPFPELRRLVVAAPAHLSDLGALEFALLQIHESTAGDRLTSHRIMQLLVKAAATSSVVRGRRMENDEQLAAVVAEAIAERRQEHPPSLVTVMLAEVAMRAHHLAVVEWSTAEPQQLIPIIRRRFHALREMGADPARIAPLGPGDLRGRWRSPVRDAGVLFSLE
jgi:AcrR family transcriptional regulator